MHRLIPHSQLHIHHGGHLELAADTECLRRGIGPGSAVVRPLTAPELDGWAITERLLKDLTRLGERVWLVVDDVHELGPAEAGRRRSSGGAVPYLQSLTEAWSKGNVDVLDDLNTPDFVDHSGLPGVSPDTAGMKQFIPGLHAAFSEVVITIEDMVAEGDRLVGRWVMRGVNTGSFNAMPATGRPVTLMGLLRVERDCFAEVWGVADIAGMLQQLGVMPAPPSA